MITGPCSRVTECESCFLKSVTYQALIAQKTLGRWKQGVDRPHRKPTLKDPRSMDRGSTDCFQEFNFLEKKFNRHGVGKVADKMLKSATLV